MLRGRTRYIVLATGLLLLIVRYISVLADGYDTFEGINDPEADWLNYLTYATLGFVVARHKSLWWAVFASTLASVVAEAARQLLIIAAWVDTPRWPEISGIFWPRYIPQAFEWFLIAVVAGGVLGLIGGLLARQPWLRKVQEPRPTAVTGKSDC